MQKNVVKKRSRVLKMYSVKREYLHASLDEMNSHYGTIEKYFYKGLGINPAAQQGLKALFLEKP
jgi:protein-tyrosine phosphatase